MKTNTKNGRLLPGGTLGLSLVFHALLLVLTGGAVLVQGIVPKSAFMISDVVEEAIVDETPPPLPDEPVPETPSPTAASDPAPEPSASAALEANPFVDTITVNSLQSSLPVAPVMASTQLGDSALSGGKTAAEGSGSGSTRNMGSLFGSSKAGTNSLTGYLYDLKQTRERKPTDMTTAEGELADGFGRENVRAREVIKDFIRTWNGDLLARYYRAKEPLSTYQFFIPTIRSQEAPRAFKVQSDVQQRRWLVHYKGDVTAVAGGRFRFVGLGDDVLIVRLQGKVVFDGSWTLIDPRANSDERYASRSGLSENMRTGSWFKINPGETYSIEVLIGEIPGGEFSSCLLIQEKDRDYPKRVDGGGPVLPVFQTAPTNLPSGSEGFYQVDKTSFALGS